MTFCNGYRVFDNQICWFLNICNVVSTDTKKDAMITINDDNGDNDGDNDGDDDGDNDGDDDMSWQCTCEEWIQQALVLGVATSLFWLSDTRHLFLPVRFLATLVALHFTPVSKSLSQWVVVSD